MNDLISRQSVIKSIRECAEAAHSNCEWEMEQGYLNSIECIEEEPPAERPHGKWMRGTEKSLWDETDDGPVYTYATTWTCSECGYKRFMTSCPDDKYCKECGTKMDNHS